MRVTRLASERQRVLLLELAVIIPALALIAFNIIHLQSIERDHAVEAAFQRDFDQVLLLTEKEMTNRAADATAGIRGRFPTPGPKAEATLVELLRRHPEASHLFLWDAKEGLALASRRSGIDEMDFGAERGKIESMISGWFPLESKEILGKLGKLEKKTGHPFFYDYLWVQRAGREVYEPMVIFPVEGFPENRPTLAGVVWDPEYLKHSFFAEALNYEADCPTNPASSGDRSRTALMLRARDQSDVLATSANWDGGKPEVERTITDGAFPGLVLGVKYRGTTIAALSEHFLRTSYAIVAALSLLLGGGIFLSYRSVNKEMALAKLKSDFVSNVSHELRTPLSLIRLYAETLEMGRLTAREKYQEYYQTIRKESERLSALINNILDFSRIEAGKKEYDFRETDLAELVQSTLESYRYQIEQHGFELRENIQQDLPKVAVDREAIARSLLNLVNNAVKYSTTNKYLAVRLYRSNGSVMLEVADHGIGIPRAEQGKIFEKFYRACDPLVHNTKGSGLGLSLVKHVVLAHGGTVAVDSVPGEGSKFTMVLPVNVAASQSRAAQVQ